MDARQEYPPLPLKITYGDKYDPAMKIHSQEEADAYFERLVEHSMYAANLTRESAERVERANLGYWAGYCSDETRARVERLFRAAHPIFGAIAEKGAPTTQQALEAGMSAGMVAGVDFGRLALRVEGDYWNAYYASKGTMDGAVLLGSIAMAAVQDRARKEAFMELMKSALNDVLSGAVGAPLKWREPETAPEHEKGGSA